MKLNGKIMDFFLLHLILLVSVISINLDFNYEININIILRECTFNIKCRNKLNNKIFTFDARFFVTITAQTVDWNRKTLKNIRSQSRAWWCHWSAYISGFRAKRDRVLLCFCHLGRNELRVETNQTGKLSLHLVRSSSVLKYSPAWRFTFMHGNAFETWKIELSERVGKMRAKTIFT